MAILVNTVLNKVSTILQDAGNIRWTSDELVGWLNDGARDLVILKPTASSTTEATTLIQGAKQSVPTGCMELIDVRMNTNGPAIRKVDRKLMDRMNPSWYTATRASATVKNYMHDLEEPDYFYVYPPQPATPGSVQIVYSFCPPTVAVGGTLALDVEYMSPLVDYVLYRAYSKDAEFAANAQLAVAHYQAFTAALRGAAAVEAAT